MAACVTQLAKMVRWQKVYSLGPNFEKDSIMPLDVKSSFKPGLQISLSLYHIDCHIYFTLKIGDHFFLSEFDPGKQGHIDNLAEFFSFFQAIPSFYHLFVGSLHRPYDFCVILRRVRTNVYVSTWKTLNFK